MNTAQLLLASVGLIYIAVGCSLCYSGRWPLGCLHFCYAAANIFLIIEASTQ